MKRLLFLLITLPINATREEVEAITAVRLRQRTQRVTIRQYRKFILGNPGQRSMHKKRHQQLFYPNSPVYIPR